MDYAKMREKNIRERNAMMAKLFKDTVKSEKPESPAKTTQKAAKRPNEELSLSEAESDENLPPPPKRRSVKKVWSVEKTYNLREKKPIKRKPESPSSNTTTPKTTRSKTTRSKTTSSSFRATRKGTRMSVRNKVVKIYKEKSESDSSDEEDDETPVVPAKKYIFENGILIEVGDDGNIDRRVLSP